MHPDISESDIQQKRETYNPRRFANEVLGEFFAGAAKPMTFDQALGCIDANMDVRSHVDAPEETYLGIDWGG